jgi:hypothetical protein
MQCVTGMVVASPTGKVAPGGNAHKHCRRDKQTLALVLLPECGCFFLVREDPHPGENKQRIGCNQPESPGQGIDDGGVKDSPVTAVFIRNSRLVYHWNRFVSIQEIIFQKPLM